MDERMDYVLKAKGVRYELAQKVLFEDLNLMLSPNEKVAIIAPNGAGKSTLLDIFAGLQVFKGDLQVCGKDIDSAGDFNSIRCDIGYLLQDSNDQFLAPIVEDDIAFTLLSSVISEDQAAQKVANIMQKLGISHLAKKVVYSLSGGEKKLVALAGVLVCEPKLLLLDEPTSSLDEQTRKKLIEILAQTNSAMVITSHDEEFLKRVATRSYTLEKGGLKEL